VNPFDLDRIRRETCVAEIEFFDTLGSTSDRALERCAAPRLATPLLVLAAEQTAGRGRGTHRWWAGPGAITASLALDADDWRLAPELWPRVSLAVAIAVADVLGRWLPPEVVRLKWPNDVWIDRRKICGILVEIPRAPVPRMVVGFGLNVDNSFDGAPDDLASTAVSLRDLLGRSVDRTEVLVALLDRFQEEAVRLADGTFDLAARWAPSCALTGRRVVHEAGGRRTSGRCLGIDDEGALRLQTESGPQRCFAGTILAVE
jgi:BirA family biotin operon repressor/biotin-[acetyl-CoA-carboxylase] ligase